MYPIHQLIKILRYLVQAGLFLIVFDEREEEGSGYEIIIL